MCTLTLNFIRIVVAVFEKTCATTQKT